MSTSTLEKPAVKVGTMVDQLCKLREKKRAAQAVVDELDKEFREKEQELLSVLDDQGLDKVSGKLATASRRTTQVANVVDWDAFYAFIHRHKHYHLLQRRVSEPAWRELMERKPVPGTEAFTKVTLGLTTL